MTERDWGYAYGLLTGFGWGLLVAIVAYRAFPA